MHDAQAGPLEALGMLASALAGKAVAVAPLQPGEPSWTDGQTIHIDVSAGARARLEAVAVQASLIAAGSLDPEVMRRLTRHRRLAQRYLAIEGHRALVGNADLLPRVLLQRDRHAKQVAGAHFAPVIEPLVRAQVVGRKGEHDGWRPFALEFHLEL